METTTIYDHIKKYGVEKSQSELVGRRVRCCPSHQTIGELDIDYTPGHINKLGDFETVESIDREGGVKISGTDVFWRPEWLVLISPEQKPGQYKNGGTPHVGDKVLFEGVVLECVRIDAWGIVLGFVGGSEFSDPLSKNPNDCFRVKSHDGLFVTSQNIVEML